SALPFVARGKQNKKRRTTSEDELTARTQKSRRLRDPKLGIAPNRSPKLRQDEVEGGIGKTHMLGVFLEKFEAEPELVIQPTRGLQLSWRDVNTNDAPRTTLLQPQADV